VTGAAPTFARLSDLTEHEVFPGFRGRFVHSERTSHVYWTIDAGAVLPEHDHPHEQVVNMIEGELELVVSGEARVLRAGDVLAIPGGARHSGRALSRVRVLDVFTPVREDYRLLDAAR
jgi:quercetin dioxygenase-like cupin family protein